MSDCGITVTVSGGGDTSNKTAIKTRDVLVRSELEPRVESKNTGAFSGAAKCESTQMMLDRSSVEQSE
jgi:hypothetical protein